MKKIEVIFSEQAEKVFSTLKDSPKKEMQTIAKGIDLKIDTLKQNPYYGDPIAKRKIPEEYLTNFKAKNLFRIKIPNFWRMLYTLKGDNKLVIIALVIDILSHPEYNKKFGYKKK